jgi:hypothetical protein
MTIAALLILALSGCARETYNDPYLAAVDRYITALDNVQVSGKQADPPPKPSYLNCPVQPEPLPQPDSAGVGLSGDTMRRTASLRDLSTRSQAQCESINTARRKAYEKAMQRYLQAVSSLGSKNVAPK